MSPTIQTLAPLVQVSPFAFLAPSIVLYRKEPFAHNSDRVYKGLIDRPFRVLKIEWSIYDLYHPDVRGTIRLVGVPSKIYEVPRKDLPAKALGPVFTLAIQGTVGFVNQGRKGASDPREITAEEYPKLPKEDISSYAHPRDEPLNEVLVDGSPPLLVRTKTVLTKLEHVKDRYDAFGDPQIVVSHNTSHRVSEYKADDAMQNSPTRI